MRRIVHLSDLHFGRHRPDMQEPLLKAIDDTAPDMVVISGDFTQRARVGQFDLARTFLSELKVPWLAVPGNHDTPLDNIWVRLFTPWKRYKAAISPELQPTFEDDEMIVAGVNTVNRFAWQRGNASQAKIAHACRAFEYAGPRSRIVVLHHPLQHGPEVEKRLTRGATEALEEFAACGAHMVLSGHLHQTNVAPFRATPGLLFIQAGSGLSDRLRGEPNSFNVIVLDGKEVRVETHAETSGTYHQDTFKSYRRDGASWIRTSQSAERVSTVRFPLK